MSPLVVRTNPASAPYAIGTGAAMRGPSRPPWPSRPWHCQQPTRSKLALPFATSPAGAAPPKLGETPKPTAHSTEAVARMLNLVLIGVLLARLRHDVDQHGLAGLHRVDAALDRCREIFRI